MYYVYIWCMYIYIYIYMYISTYAARTHSHTCVYVYISIDICILQRTCLFGRSFPLRLLSVGSFTKGSHTLTTWVNFHAVPARKGSMTHTSDLKSVPFFLRRLAHSLGQLAVPFQRIPKDHVKMRPAQPEPRKSHVIARCPRGWPRRRRRT